MSEGAAMRIVFTPQLSAAVADIGESLLPDGFSLEYLAGEDERDKRVEQLENADFVLGFLSGNRLPSSEYKNLRKARLIQLLSAGYDGIDLEVLRQLRIPLADNGGANAVAVAEHTIMLMLAVNRQLVDLDHLMREGGWKNAQLGQETSHELEGQTIGIIGAGRIGRAVARRLAGWDVDLVYYDPVRVPPDEERALKLKFCELDEVLAQSDAITLHAPANASTHEMIGERAIGLMKPSAILINCARGELVDENALHAALSNGRIAAAGLDTFANEPPNAENPLRSLPNVVLTPHAAGPTWESWPKRFANGYANIERVGRGEQPHWVVPELQDLLDTPPVR
jgi:glyoxylate reductase/D-3-phosphoglycerate dehydrogenase